ncbi:MAG: YbhB/YbcL family Raf kinase inhibitor-like protein [Deltaproteobacteria bacterium]|nr:YbhB/YbcL family Raf kinase inhibitor-like protein [Deltaproteobacteria bacterium]
MTRFRIRRVDRWPWIVALTALLMAGGCDDTAEGDDDDGSGGSGTGGTASGSGGATGGGGGSGGMLPFALTSTAFAEGDTIPQQYECGAPAPVTGPGQNLTPPLSWTPGPPGTLSYAVVTKDLTAGITHWAIYDIPAVVTSLPEGIPDGYQPANPGGSKQAEIQGSGWYGYFGPCSPSSINTYQWTVHALPSEALPGVDMSTTETNVAAAIEGASIASASLSGQS